MSQDLHVLLDTSALVAAGRGNRIASKLISYAHSTPGWYLYTTVCALVEAERERPGTGPHIAALPGITILDLDLAAALAVAAEPGWAAAHTRYAAQPSLERPDGALVATVEPDQWKGRPVRVLDLTP